MVEVGIPYSDPIADGPVIAASYHRALGRGVKLDQIFQMLRGLRAEAAGRPSASAPFVTMVSYAIVLRRGVDRYLREAVAAGVDGLIVPDLPVEEAEGLCRKATEHDLRLIQLITPTTPRDRAVRIARATTGFIYYVSVAGITGERTTLPPELAENVAWLRTQTDLPICIGFGISLPEHIRTLAPVADGLIVGSALVRRLIGAEGRPAVRGGRGHRPDDRRVLLQPRGGRGAAPEAGPRRSDLVAGQRLGDLDGVAHVRLEDRGQGVHALGLAVDEERRARSGRRSARTTRPGRCGRRGPEKPSRT